MYTTWSTRKQRLGVLLGSDGSETEEGLALDRLLHGQRIIGGTSKTSEVEAVRFTDNDLILIGTLEFGQFSVVDVVKCSLDARLYIRKSIEKRFAYKTRDQCNPQVERDILLLAREKSAVWVPHLLCAFQTETHLNLLMPYAEGGTLWDVLESSPLDGRIIESDLLWWLPQIIAALDWCHEHGFVHRDVKPHNFVVTNYSYIQLIDFGSAAPLLPQAVDGSRQVLRRFCLVPCGTCDYISPEILQAHEAALVALEMSETLNDPINPSEISAKLNGYGLETDWWSMGAMVYEMIYGIAPFFANDVRTTYLKIMDHKRSLHFSSTIPVSSALQDLIARLLTDSSGRLGRYGVADIQNHPFFSGVSWQDLHRQSRPESLHLPVFTYSDEPVQVNYATTDGIEPLFPSLASPKFDFSAFFNASQLSSHVSSAPQLALHTNNSRSILRERASDYFIGFSWGPTQGAFAVAPQCSNSPLELHLRTPRRILAINGASSRPASPSSTPLYPFVTPLRPSLQTPQAGFSTLPRTSAIRRTVRRRAVSDREAMRQLVDCVGKSAQKKVLAAGRTPRTIGRSMRYTGTEKTIRFVPAPIEIGLNSMRYERACGADATVDIVSSEAQSLWDYGDLCPTEDESGSIPPSPSPSPRPGSAMSMLSRRSATPTMGTWSMPFPGGGLGPPGKRSGSPVDAHSRIPLPPDDPSGHSMVEGRQRTPASEIQHTSQEHIRQSSRPMTGVTFSGKVAVVEMQHSLKADVLKSLEARYDNLLAEIALLSQKIEQCAQNRTSGQGHTCLD
ncbi:kinase-like domain-containing protein [Vararia minispora EC-137]|uniref:Kinase-like domain-containing protein n=1 Tax=Vararia minispora EC-137 TaxID=1314806 RepID=A0ACB8QAL6_9AGAM|nr:kinase-like domain-containing protein [Vararia minispora EC-137]